MDVSSNVKWGYQDNFNSAYFLFFSGKTLNAKKHVTSKNQVTKQKKWTKSNKGNNFLYAQKLLTGWKGFVLRFSASSIFKILS